MKSPITIFHSVVPIFKPRSLNNKYSMECILCIYLIYLERLFKLIFIEHLRQKNVSIISLPLHFLPFLNQVDGEAVMILHSEHNWSTNFPQISS